MKLSEIATNEHQTAPMELDVTVHQQRKWLSHAVRTDLVTAAPGADAISMFKLEFNSSNHVLSLRCELIRLNQLAIASCQETRNNLKMN